MKVCCGYFTHPLISQNNRIERQNPKNHYDFSVIEHLFLFRKSGTLREQKGKPSLCSGFVQWFVRCVISDNIFPWFVDSSKDVVKGG